MLIEIYKKGSLIRRETSILNTLSWDNELMLTPTLDLTFPADVEFDGREEVKVFVNDKCFWGIVKEVEYDKKEETVKVNLDHIISEWEYRQISVNHAMDNKELNIVYKGSNTKKDAGNDETITANSFTVSAKKVSKLTTANWVEKANAQAWVTSNGDKVSITKADTSKIKGKDGEYDITFSTAKGTSITVKATVKEEITYQGRKTKSNKTNKETISAVPFSILYDVAKDMSQADIVKRVKAKAWVYHKKGQSVAVASTTTNFEPVVGEYNVTASTAKGTSVTVKVTVEEDTSYSNVNDPSVIDKLEDIYSDFNFAYPGWEIDIQDGADTMIDYVYSKQNKLEALTKTMELTPDLFWRVGFWNEKLVEIGKFGKRKPYIVSTKPSGKTNISILQEPVVKYDFRDVINVATVYSNKSDGGMSSLTMREVYENPDRQLDGFPVVILRENVNNERDYTAYITQYPLLAPNNELEYAVLDEESIALESGTLIEGSFAFDDISAFKADEDEDGNTVTKKITDEDRIKAAETAYHAAIKKLKNSRRSYDVVMTVEELPVDILPGDRIRFIYDNYIWNLDACSNYWKKILSYNDWFYVTRIHYEVDENEIETNEITLSKYIKIDRETSEQ